MTVTKIRDNILSRWASADHHYSSVSPGISFHCHLLQLHMCTAPVRQSWHGWQNFHAPSVSTPRL